jgi:DNA primase
VSTFKYEFLERIRNLPILDVVSPYVHLTRTGSRWRGLSPFTHEKTPSFFVHPDKNFFKCFSSGYAGDVFKFIQLNENLSFPEAVECLANRFGIPMEYQNRHAQIHPPSLKKEWYELYEAVHRHFVDRFRDDRDATSERTRRYWTEERQLSLDSAETFGIGFAPVPADDLWKALIYRHFRPELLRQSGLFYTSSHASTGVPYSRFRGRLTIPIRDIQGRVIAFSGRQLPFLEVPSDPARDAKYINSPETLLFSKGKVLFNLDRARLELNGERNFFLVEGPLDVVRCHENHLATAIAPQGTGITEAQLQLVRRYNAPVICFLDGDVAGKKSGLRLFSLGLKVGVPMHFWILENEKDPDTFLLKHPWSPGGSTPWVHPVDFLVRTVRSLESDKSRATAQILETLFSGLTQSDSALIVQDYLRRTSLELCLSQRALQADFEAFSRAAVHPTERSAEPTSRLQSLRHTVEWHIVTCLFCCDQELIDVVQGVDERYFSDNVCAQILKKIVRQVRAGQLTQMSSVATLEFTEEEREVWFSL